MRRTISSRLTQLYKVIFPTIWIGGFALGTALMFIPAKYRGAPGTVGEFHDEKWQFLAMTLVGALVLWRTCMPLKRVELDQHSLYISNFQKEIVVPLAEVVEVKENRWIDPRPVTIRFRSHTDFGQSITFMPETVWFLFFSPHPIVQELRSAVDRALGSSEIS